MFIIYCCMLEQHIDIAYKWEMYELYDLAIE